MYNEIHEKIAKKTNLDYINRYYICPLILNLGATLYFYQIACVRIINQLDKSKPQVLIILWFKNLINYQNLPKH